MCWDAISPFLLFADLVTFVWVIYCQSCATVTVKVFHYLLFFHDDLTKKWRHSSVQNGGRSPFWIFRIFTCVVRSQSDSAFTHKITHKSDNTLWSCRLQCMYFPLWRPSAINLSYTGYILKYTLAYRIFSNQERLSPKYGDVRFFKMASVRNTKFSKFEIRRSVIMANMLYK